MEQHLTQTQQQQMQQVLSPQLRQSLELLQVPMLELRGLIQQHIEQNPALEEGADEEEAQPELEAQESTPEPEGDELSFDEEYERLAQLDDEWREFFRQNRPIRAVGSEQQNKQDFALESLSKEPELQEHLLSQLYLSELTTEQIQLGELIIGSINEEGYLTAELDGLSASTGYAREAFEQVLSTIQEFDPAGIGARDLRECLPLQGAPWH